MKKLALFLLGVYVIVATWLAIPTVGIMLEDDNKSLLALNAGGSDEQWEFLKDIAKFIDFADMAGYKLSAGEMYRTMHQQRYYVAHGLSKTFNSKHLKRRAFDFNLFIDNKYVTDCGSYEPLALYWESLSPKNSAGALWKSFKDCGHIQRSN
jgi:hypothetical protein